MMHLIMCFCCVCTLVLCGHNVNTEYACTRTSAFRWSAPGCICLTSTCSTPKECIAITTVVGHCPCECCGCWYPRRSIGNRKRSPTVHSCVVCNHYECYQLEHTWTLRSSTIPLSIIITPTSPFSVSIRYLIPCVTLIHSCCSIVIM